jgi:hypothetical protein
VYPPAMLRTGLLLGATLALALPCACQKAASAPTLAPIVTDTVDDKGATFKVEVAWRNVAADEVELVIEMAATGIEQTDNLVVDVKTEGLVITEGVPDWTGFILPRERYSHKVRYKLLDEETTEASAVLTIRRTLDSSLLWNTELAFVRTDSGGITLVSE